MPTFEDMFGGSKTIDKHLLSGEITINGVLFKFSNGALVSTHTLPLEDWRDTRINQLEEENRKLKAQLKEIKRLVEAS